MADSCKETVKTIESSQVHEMLEEDKENLPLLVDVRQPEEYKEGHIPGALLVPLGQLEYGHPSFSKKKTMITYCRSGKRSMTAAVILCKMGYSQVKSLEGGILQWPYELVTGEPRPTLESDEIGTARELFLLALKKEIETWLFYRESKSNLDNPELVKVFEFLEGMEKDHMETMYSRYSRTARQMGEDVLPLAALREKYKETFDRTRGDWDELDDETEISLLESAVQREYQKYDFYKLSVDHMEDNSLRVLLNELALEERAHASLLLKKIGQVKERKGKSMEEF